jgi:cathepsin F
MKRVGDLPDSFDWRDHGAVTPVKDQGSVGTCWAFSAIQNIEGQYNLKGNDLINLSVEQIVECDGTNDKSSENSDCGVYGGWPYLAIDYVKRAVGFLF